MMIYYLNHFKSITSAVITVILMVDDELYYYCDECVIADVAGFIIAQIGACVKVTVIEVAIANG